MSSEASAPERRAVEQGRGLIDWSSRPPIAETSIRGAHLKNEDVAAFCKEQGPRFVGVAGVDPHKGMQAVRELEHAVRELGLRGLNLQCFEHKLAINDPKMYPLYAKCIELGVPVNIHCGINFSTESLMEYGRPILLDQVMTHFPDLRVCAAPPGWPWVHELRVESHVWPTHCLRRSIHAACHFSAFWRAPARHPCRPPGPECARQPNRRRVRMIVAPPRPR